MDNLLQDLRFGLRMLTKSPGFTAVAVLALALGIGANTAIFSVVNAVLLRPLPFAEPDRVVAIIGLLSRTGGEENNVSYPDFVDVRDQNRSFAATSAYRTRDVGLTGDRAPEAISATVATSGLFDVLGVGPLLGRTLLPEDDAIGAPPVVVVGHKLWQRRFDSNPRLVGGQIQLDGRSFTVVGVMPPAFRFPTEYGGELYVPLSTDAYAVEAFTRRGRHFMEGVARLATGVTLQQAREDLDRISLEEERLYPGTNEGAGFKAVPLHERLVRQDRPTLLLLMAAVGFVLLIACANVANLLLARSASRQHEVAIRLALGAGRARLARQFLTESVLLACLGGALGALLSLWGVDLLAATVLSNVPRVSEVHVDGTALAATAALSIGTGLLFGIFPALAASRTGLHDALREGAGRLSAGARRHRVQGALVVAQIALALVLLTGAGLTMRSLLRLTDVDPGFNPQGVLTLQASLPDSRYDRDAKLAFFGRVLDRVSSLPGVDAAALAGSMPFSHGNNTASIEVEGAPPPAPGEFLIANVYFVSPDYFAAMGIRLLSGRTFTSSEVQGSAGHVMLINERLARRSWPGGDPLGKRITPSIANYADWHVVTGVVADVKHQALDAPAPLQVYIPYTEARWTLDTVVVRTSAHPASLSGALRNVMREADPELPIAEPALLRDNLAESMLGRRSMMTLLGAFAGLALLLSAIGVYGLLAYWVTERRREIGIRTALGCESSAVLRLVVGQGLRLVLFGIGIGLIAAYATTRLLANVLYGVTATDPATFAAVSLVLACVALIASYLPARRAARLDPMLALRGE